MFTLDADIPKVEATMFAHGRSVIVDIEIWHKRIGHMNIHKLNTMQMQRITAGLPKFKVDGMQKLCEPCQMDKQARHAFAQNVEVSNIALEVIHLDVWTTKATSIGECHYYVSFIDDHTRQV